MSATAQWVGFMQDCPQSCAGGLCESNAARGLFRVYGWASRFLLFAGQHYPFPPSSTISCKDAEQIGARAGPRKANKKMELTKTAAGTFWFYGWHSLTLQAPSCHYLTEASFIRSVFPHFLSSFFNSFCLLHVWVLMFYFTLSFFCCFFFLLFLFMDFSLFFLLYSLFFFLSHLYLQTFLMSLNGQAKKFLSFLSEYNEKVLLKVHSQCSMKEGLYTVNFSFRSSTLAASSLRADTGCTLSRVKPGRRREPHGLHAQVNSGSTREQHSAQSRRLAVESSPATVR